MMLGRRLARLYPARVGRPPRIGSRCSVDAFTVGHRASTTSTLTLHEGEMLGVAGLQGHGQRELFLALFGAIRAQGQVSVCGRPVTIRSPRHALSAGIGMVLLPEDRRQQGLLLTKSVRENLVLSALGKVARFGVIDPRAEAAMVERGIAADADQGGHARTAGRDAVGWQSAEGRAGQAARDRALGSCCSTTRPAASMSGPRPRSSR